MPRESVSRFCRRRGEAPEEAPIAFGFEEKGDENDKLCEYARSLA